MNCGQPRNYFVTTDFGFEFKRGELLHKNGAIECLDLPLRVTKNDATDLWPNFKHFVSVDGPSCEGYSKNCLCLRGVNLFWQQVTAATSFATA